MENKLTDKEIKNRQAYMTELHKKGMSYKDIGKMFGISKQRVHQIIGGTQKRYFRVITTEKCVFAGIRKWLNDNEVSIGAFTKLIYGNKNTPNYERTSKRLKGEWETPKTYIDKVLEITGLTYEQAFKK